jgi:hypothetical protein
MALVPCPRCRRHLHHHTEACPFCGAARDHEVGGARYRKAGALLLAGTGFVTLLSACYGPPRRAIQDMDAPDAAPSGTARPADSGR